MSTSLPRPVLLALLGAVAVAGLFLVTRGRGNEEGGSVPAVTPPAQTSTGPGAASAAKPATPSAPTAKPGASGRARSSQSRTLPAPVSKALAAHKVVVLLFWSPRGVDDRSVKAAVDALPRHGGKVAVFTNKLNHFARYTRIAAAANVAQTPTLIVTNRKGVARVATGYLDPTTVEQYVVDALHGAP
jgi:hypothetical protein